MRSTKLLVKFAARLGTTEAELYEPVEIPAVAKGRPIGSKKP